MALVAGVVLPRALDELAGDGSDELTAVIGDPIARVGTWALMALMATIIFIMVVKPLG